MTDLNIIFDITEPFIFENIVCDGPFLFNDDVMIAHAGLQSRSLQISK